MMNYNCPQVLSFVVLLLGTAAIVASVCSDYWTDNNALQLVGQSITFHRGLWRQCTSTAGLITTESCEHRFAIDFNVESADQQVNFSHSNVEAWEISCLALMVASGVFGILALLFSPCCCNRCGLCLTLTCLLATLCASCGIGLYAYHQTTGRTITLENLGDDLVNNIKDFGWSFWVAVGGALGQLSATLGFGVSRARQHAYSHSI